MPDYAITLEGEQVMFRNRGTMQPAKEISSQMRMVFISPDTYELAREAAPGWDVHYLESEWRDWMKEAPKNADKAFLGFCRKWRENHGYP